MGTYILLTKLAPEVVEDTRAYEELGRRVTEKIHQECPEARWISSYSILGPYDYIDIFEAPDETTATKVALIVRSFGHATTEIWVGMPYDRFIEMAKGIAIPKAA